MTWAATYTNQAFLSATDWLAVETNAGGAVVTQATALIYKDNTGAYRWTNGYFGGAVSATVPDLYLDFATRNWIGWNANGLGAPAFGTRSAGVKLCLYPAIDVAAADYAIGVEPGAIWFGVPIAAGTFFAWYGGNTLWYQMDGAALKPGADNTRSLGTGALRWSVVYAGTGTINTSDEREKALIEAVPDAWLDAWGDVSWCRFKFAAAVAEKGEAARWHIGAVAQAVRDAFAARALDALAIGLLCYDEWEAEEPVEAVLGEEGELISPPRPGRDAGDLWGLRYDECFAMEAAWQRRELARLAARLDAAGL